MSDELKPALSAKQWAEGATEDAYIDADGICVYPGSPEAAFSANEIPALIALANHALPADSPYKITRDDVAWIREAIADTPRASVADGLEALAAKLESLLPPPSVPSEPRS